LIVLIGGCAVAVVRDQNNDEKKDLKLDRDLTSLDLMSTYGERSGALSISEMVTSPSMVEKTDSFKDRVAFIKVTPFEGDEIEILVPSEKDYNDHPREENEMWSGYLPIDIDGMVMPGLVEVVLYG
jgi:hypothetical protein